MGGDAPVYEAPADAPSGILAPARTVPQEVIDQALYTAGNEPGSAERDVYKRQGKGWAFRFAETAGPALRSDGVPGSLKRILSARRSTGSRGSIRPVSYTHLDVYKRQVSGTPLCRHRGR